MQYPYSLRVLAFNLNGKSECGSYVYTKWPVKYVI